LMPVHRHGHEGEFLLIPVWDFYGYDVSTIKEFPLEDDFELRSLSMWGFGDINEEGELTVNWPFLSYLTINAIDGSIIDRVRGY